jgi:hypothetical protein
MNDTDTTEPDWFELPGREEYEKIVPKKYWAKPSKSGIEVPLVHLRYHIEKLEEEQQALAQGDAAMAADTLFHSEGSVDSMSLGSQIDSEDSLILLEEDSPCKNQKLLAKAHCHQMLIRQMIYLFILSLPVT